MAAFISLEYKCLEINLEPRIEIGRDFVISFVAAHCGVTETDRERERCVT